MKRRIVIRSTKGAKSIDEMLHSAMRKAGFGPPCNVNSAEAWTGVQAPEVKPAPKRNGRKRGKA